MTEISYSTDRTFSAFRIAEGRTSPKLLDVYRDALRVKHYSPRTEDTYVSWVKNFILFHKKRHPREMGVDEIGQYLTHLASDKNISASTQNQACSAILFLYRHILQIELDEVSLARFRPQRSRTVPTVLSKEEVGRLLANLISTPKLIAQIMYGGGLRVMETMRLRVQDIDFDNRQACAEPVEASSFGMGKGKMTVLQSFPNRSFHHCAFTLKTLSPCIKRMYRMVLALSTFRLRSNKNTHMPIGNGTGSMSFLRPNFQWINGQGFTAGTTFTRP